MLIDCYEDFNTLFREAGFHLRDWCPNSNKLSDIIDKVFRLFYSEVPFVDNNVIVLGMVWNIISDELSFITMLLC